MAPSPMGLGRLNQEAPAAHLGRSWAGEQGPRQPSQQPASFLLLTRGRQSPPAPSRSAGSRPQLLQTPKAGTAACRVIRGSQTRASQASVLLPSKRGSKHQHLNRSVSVVLTPPGNLLKITDSRLTFSFSSPPTAPLDCNSGYRRAMGELEKEKVSQAPAKVADPQRGGQEPPQSEECRGLPPPCAGKVQQQALEGKSPTG